MIVYDKGGSGGSSSRRRGGGLLRRAGRAIRRIFRRGR